MSSLRRSKGHTLLIILASCFLVSLVVASPAWAHITVHPSTLPAGSSDIELTFRVPNERDNANTVKAQVFFPDQPPAPDRRRLADPGMVFGGANAVTGKAGADRRRARQPDRHRRHLDRDGPGHRARTVRGLRSRGWLGSQQTRSARVQGASDLLLRRDRPVDPTGHVPGSQPGYASAHPHVDIGNKRIGYISNSRIAPSHWIQQHHNGRRVGNRRADPFGWERDRRCGPGRQRPPQAGELN